MQQPNISVVVATRNSARYLDECLASITAQSVPVRQIIIVDAASDDGTVSIAEQHRTVEVHQQSGVGLWQAWNQGIGAATSDFIDSDDRWTPGTLTDHCSALDQVAGAVASVGRVRYFLDAPAIPTGFRPELLQGDHLAFMPGATLVHRSVFDVVGLYPEHLESGSDIAWFHALRTSGLTVTASADVV